MCILVSGPTIVSLMFEFWSFYTSKLGYEKNAQNGEKLNVLGDWAKANLPHDDNDPEHPDVVSLFTRYQVLV